MQDLDWESNLVPLNMLALQVSLLTAWLMWRLRGRIAEFRRRNFALKKEKISSVPTLLLLK